MADDQTERPIVKVAGSEISEGLYEDLTSAIVEQSVQVPDMFTLRFYDPDFTIFEGGTFSIGSEVEISFSDGDAVTVVTTAEITAISVEPEPSGRHELVVSGLDKGHRLARGAKLRTFSEVTDGDIVGEIAGDHSLSTDLDSTSTTYPWLVQDQNDYAFLSERARLIGFEWWVSDSTLHFKKIAKNGSSPALEWPDSLYSFKVRFSAAEAVQDVTVRGWDPATQTSFVGTSTVTVGSDELGTDAPAGTEADAAMQEFTGTRFTGLAPVTDQTEAEALANSIAKRSFADEVDARGIAVGKPGLKAGSEVKIDGLGDKLSGKYLLTAVDHVYRAGERYITRFRAGGREPASLVDLLAKPSQSRQPELGTRLIAGVVTDTNDPDNAGRVKVKFPTLSDDAESDWARIAAPGAGDTRGLSIYPEIDDEVLVGFEDGDPRRPLILGGLWSKKLVPPQTAAEAVADDKVVTKGYYSRLGHKLEFSDGDSEDAKSVTIELEDGSTSLYLGEDKVTLDTPKTVTITAQDDIKVTTSSSGVTIEASTITLKASQDLKLEGTNVSIKGTAGVKIEGGQTDVKATGMLNVEASGIASVKGSLLKLN